MGLLIALLSIGLAACGYRSTAEGSISSTLSQTQVKKCGTVASPGRLEVPVNETGAAQVENCLWQAFSKCQPAMLVFTMSSINTSLIRTFTIHNDRGKCSITDAVQLRTGPGTPPPAVIYTCTGLIKLPGALRFTSCGKDGDIIVLGA